MLQYKEVILYAILTIIIFIFSLTKLQPEIIKIIDLEKNIGEQTVQATDLESRLASLKKAEEERMTLSEQTKDIYKPDTPGLDAEASFTVIFDDIIEMAKYNRVKIYSIEYVYDPAEDEFVKGAADRYHVCQLNMSIIADYSDLQGFLKDVYKYPYLINVNKLEMTPYPKNKKILMSNLQIKLYSSK